MTCSAANNKILKKVNMTIEIANYIDAIIPGAIGLLILIFPNLFVKKDTVKDGGIRLYLNQDH